MKNVRDAKNQAVSKMRKLRSASLAEALEQRCQPHPEGQGEDGPERAPV